MGFFPKDYDEPGPGVDPNEPRKKGVQRFVEVLLQNFGNLVKLNLLYCACVLPSLLLFFLAIQGPKISPLFLLLGLVAAIPMGAGTSALYYCVSKMLRDDPGFLWYDFKRKFKENFKCTAAVGVLTFAIFYAYLLLFLRLMGGGFQQEIPFGLTIIFLLGLLLVGIIVPYYFLQAPYLELRPMQMLKNSAILAFRYPFRSLAGLVCGGAFGLLFLLFLPISLFLIPLVLFLAFSLSALLRLMWIWPPVNEQFKIEETLNLVDQG